jgi:hypothetical protein
MKRRILLTVVLLLLGVSQVLGQTTGFTYQGKLTDGGAPANGNYDLQFALFDSADGGAQVGQPQTINAVSVRAGVFTVALDFGANAFPGASRFLEISTRPSAGGAFTLLTPRQVIMSTPYALRSLSAATADTATGATNATNATNAQQLAGVAASQYVLTGDARLSNSRTPTAGSSNYIQNTTNQQTSGNFNISGDGTAGGTLSARLVSATSAYSLNGSLMLRAPSDNMFFGIGTGSFEAGRGNTVLGFSAGTDLSAESRENTFVGYEAAFLNPVHGSHNTLLGANTRIGSPDPISNATAIGDGASVSQSNSLVLGNGGVNVGIGVTAPQFKLHVIDSGNKGLRAETGSRGGTVASFGGFGEFQIDAPGAQGGRFAVHENGSVVLGDCPGCFSDVTDRLVVSGTARIVNLGSGGSTSLCRNGSAQISVCSSSVRYKTNIADFSSGLNLVNRLRPVTFDWKDSQAHDLGLVAEEVAAVEPLLVTRNDKGEVEGVKYDRLSAVFVNAFKEQQAQIERQQAEIEKLKRLVCSSRRRAGVCK